MRPLATLLLGALASFGPGQSPGRAGYALKDVRVLDLRAGSYSPPSVVLISGERIARILPTSAYRSDLADRTIELGGAYLLPGLIDGHVHLSLAGTLRANALATLEAGFTTVVDLGARGTRVLRLRDSINAGAIPGPRILAAGLWIGIQGGVCEFNGIGVAGGPDAFRRRVSENVDAGADVIKLCVSGWPAEAFGNPGKYELSDEVLTASVAEAHRAKKLAIAHDLSRAGVAAGLRAGVDGLAHAAYLDSALALDLKRRNAFLIPTLASLTGNDSTAASRELRSSVRLAHRLGVRIVFGTDAGVLPHGQNAIEFAALREAGLSPLEAIRAATIDAATALRLADSVGEVKPGKVADLVVLDADPLQNLAVLATPRLVMARGILIQKSGSLSRIRGELEQAYAANTRAFLQKNVDTIMALRHADFHTIDATGTRRDREAMRQYTIGFLNGIERWLEIKFQIDSLTVEDDLALAIVKQYVDRMGLRPEGVRRVQTWVTQRETWKRTPEGWRMWRVDQLRDQRRWIDGKP